MNRGVAVVTGASSGIGAATAAALVEAGFEVVLGARREARLAQFAESLGTKARAMVLDVSDEASVDAFCAQIEECHLLLNNAGGALGLDSISQANVEHWKTMFETNVLGTLYMTKALLPKLIASGDGQVITIGSVAAFEAYVGGGGYNAAKHAERAVMDVLRMESLGQPIRVCEIDPGMVETEFSLVRFDGNRQRADAVYQGMIPLSAEDIAQCVVFAATRPSHVDIDQMIVRPRDQARVGLVHRHLEPS